MRPDPAIATLEFSAFQRSPSLSARSEMTSRAGDQPDPGTNTECHSDLSRTGGPKSPLVERVRCVPRSPQIRCSRASPLLSSRAFSNSNWPFGSPSDAPSAPKMRAERDAESIALVRPAWLRVPETYSVPPASASVGERRNVPRGSVVATRGADHEEPAHWARFVRRRWSRHILGTVRAPSHAAVANTTIAMPRRERVPRLTVLAAADT